jgi:Helix-loop-helix DNA-binding domain
VKLSSNAPGTAYVSPATISSGLVPSQLPNPIMRSDRNWTGTTQKSDRDGKMRAGISSRKRSAPMDDDIESLTSSHTTGAVDASVNDNRKPSPKLRTSRRMSKQSKKAAKAPASQEVRDARASHNQVEKNYRNRLNNQFERLLSALPSKRTDDDGGTDGGTRALSRAEVLDLAAQRIRSLEKENNLLGLEMERLKNKIGRL